MAKRERSLLEVVVLLVLLMEEPEEQGPQKVWEGAAVDHRMTKLEALEETEGLLQGAEAEEQEAEPVILVVMEELEGLDSALYIHFKNETINNIKP